jgi:hypothetical protein
VLLPMSLMPPLLSWFEFKLNKLDSESLSRASLIWEFLRLSRDKVAFCTLRSDIKLAIDDLFMCLLDSWNSNTPLNASDTTLWNVSLGFDSEEDEVWFIEDWSWSRADSITVANPFWGLP